MTNTLYIITILIITGYSAVITYILRRMKIQNEQTIQTLNDTLNSKVKSTATQRSTIKGQLAEQFLPLMPQNTHEPSDMRFLGDFVDYIVVDGYGRCKDEGHDYIDGITFIEIKTGKAQLSRHQKLIRDAVQAGRVHWETIRLP